MSVQMVLIAAVVSTAGLHAIPQEPIGLTVEQHRQERVAQTKRDTEVPGALPGRSESSEEARPSTRAPKKSKKPAGGETDAKKKETPRKGEKKDPQ